MGVVYVAVDEMLHRQVALKVVAPDAAADPAAKERFLREARAAAKLKSDHVIKLLDVGMHDGLPYMAMELLDGRDLADLLDHGGALAPAQAVSFALQALDGIIDAHDAGIVHRDLKPSNLFVEKRKDAPVRIKVLDFGISKALNPSVDAQVTKTGLLMGSPGYMAPEQIRNAKAVDPRTDVWALGVILWEMLVGTDAFTGESIGEIFSKIREESLAPVSTLRPEVSRELSEIVLRATARNPDARYANARDLRAALHALTGMPAVSVPVATDVVDSKREVSRRAASSVEAKTLVAAPRSPPSAASSELRGSTAASWTGSTPAAPAKRMMLTVAAVASLALGATAVYFAIAALTRAPIDHEAPRAAEPATAPESPAGPSALADAPVSPPPSTSPSPPSSADLVLDSSVTSAGASASAQKAPPKPSAQPPTKPAAKPPVKPAIPPPPKPNKYGL
jgi:serine/threonine-protein kinase